MYVYPIRANHGQNQFLSRSTNWINPEVSSKGGWYDNKLSNDNIHVWK